MPRRARLAVEGIPWHIIQRGNSRTACFYCADDYLRYLAGVGIFLSRLLAIRYDISLPRFRFKQ